MRTTLNLDDDLIRKAQKVIGIYEKTALIHLGLRSLLKSCATPGFLVSWFWEVLSAKIEKNFSNSCSLSHK